LAGATSNVQANGQVIVSIGGHMLVTGNQSLTLTTVADSANKNLARVQWASGAEFKANHGELTGLLKARDEIIPKQQAALDVLAVEFANQVNGVHRTGFGMDGTTGLNFFTDGNPANPPTNALDLRLNTSLNVTNLAAAEVNNAPGDGGLAKRIADLQNSQVMSTGTVTFNAFYSTQVTQLGLDVQRAQINAHNQGLVVNAMDMQRESVTGVNLDEEAANMAKFQRAYQAAARVMTAYDEMLERVINGLGLVGR
jgi:flagellar hook-associated protein 1 FlgK